MGIVCEVLDAADALMAGDFQAFASEASGLAQMAMAE
jgi:hypothetical protein